MYPCLVKFCWLFFESSLQFSHPRLWHNVCFFNPISMNRRDNSLEGLNLVSMEDAVKLSRCFCVVEHCHAEEHYRLASFSVSKLSSLWLLEKRFKRQTLCQGRGSGSKNNQQKFTRQGYLLSFEGGTLLLRETVTMLSSRNVIHRGPALFWYMIQIPVGYYSCTKEKGITHARIYMHVYIYISSLITLALFILSFSRTFSFLSISLCLNFSPPLSLLLFFSSFYDGEFWMNFSSHSFW